MTTITECDGCGARIGLAISPLGLVGEVTAADGITHALHWCRNCAAVAVKAVREAHQAGTQSGEDIIREAMTEAQEHPGRTVTR